MSALAKLVPLLAPDDDHSLTLDHLVRVHRITTDVELAFAPPLPPHPLLPPALLDHLQHLVTTHLAAPAMSGTYLLQQSRDRKGKQRERYSTSLDDLDVLLDGGFSSGELVDVSGPRRSGRTLFALYVVLLHLLLHADKRAAWLDTTGSFDAFRCLAILRDVLVPRLYALGGSFAGDDGIEPEPQALAIATLDRLAVSNPRRSGDALDVLAAETEATGKSETLSMVVVDSLDVLVGGEALSNGSAQGHANLIAFMRRLGTLARSPTVPLAILVVTAALPASSPSTSRAPVPTAPAPAAGQPPPLSSLPLPEPLRPSLGSTFAYLVDLSVLLTPAEPLFGPVDGKGKTVLEVTRNARGDKGATVVFKLEGGVALEQL
ncbi:hypothetical protein JCM9279_006666 [Rhodotorula babjevae]